MHILVARLFTAVCVPAFVKYQFNTGLSFGILLFHHLVWISWVICPPRVFFLPRLREVSLAFLRFLFNLSIEIKTHWKKRTVLINSLCWPRMQVGTTCQPNSLWLDPLNLPTSVSPDWLFNPLQNSVCLTPLIINNFFLLPSSDVHCGQHERRLLSDLLGNYNPLERPVANESEPVQVSFGITLQQIIDVVRSPAAPWASTLLQTRRRLQLQPGIRDLQTRQQILQTRHQLLKPTTSADHWTTESPSDRTN